MIFNNDLTPDEEIANSEFITNNGNNKEKESVPPLSNYYSPTIFLPIQEYQKETNEFYAYRPQSVSIKGDVTSSEIYWKCISETSKSDSGYFQILRTYFTQAKQSNYFSGNITGGILISIPQYLIGEGIQRNSLAINCDTTDFQSNLVDDGYGNIKYKDGGLNLSGSVIYGAGLIYFPDEFTLSYIWKDQFVGDGDNHIYISYNSTVPIREKIWRCYVPDGMMNNTLNKTSYYPSNSIYGTKIKNNISGNFQVYITSIGLYNEKNECLAVAKLAKPFKKPKELDCEFYIRIDM